MNDFQIQTASQLTSHLRSLRKSMGMTQAQLGERLGVEQARIAKIERSPGTVSVDQLLELLSALNAAVFIRRKNKIPSPPTDARVSW